MPPQSFALIDDTFADFLANDLLVKTAQATWERQGYYTLRREVFSDEQQLLAQDRDEKDFQAIPIVAVAHHCGMPERVVGAVRIYETDPGVWYGGRLCVERAYRRHGMIGKALINEAVARAIELGCHTFLATVQHANEAYFLGLHWHTLNAVDVFGHAHCLMQAQLDCYPFMPRNVALPSRKVVRHD